MQVQVLSLSAVSFETVSGRRDVVPRSSFHLLFRSGGTCPLHHLVGILDDRNPFFSTLSRINDSDLLHPIGSPISHVENVQHSAPATSRSIQSIGLLEDPATVWHCLGNQGDIGTLFDPLSY